MAKRPMQGMLDEYLKCRTFGHAWDDFYPTGMRSPEFGVRVSVRCDRCRTERHDLVSRDDGSLLQRGYYYPEDYAIAEVYGRNDFRLEYVSRRRRRPRKPKLSVVRSA